MRKTVQSRSSEASPRDGALDIERLAHVFVTSETAGHPIENAFDGRGGRGGTQWVASEPGLQTITVAFDTPQAVEDVTIEIEEVERSRTQEVVLATSSNAGLTFDEVVRQEFNFSPPATTFERETWTLKRPGVTHARLEIRPDKGGRDATARLTSLVVRSANGT